MADEIQVIELDDSSDPRGLSFSVLDEHLGLIGPARDVHIGEIRPGQVRGNHFHDRRGELIAVVAKDSWSVHWDTGAGTEPRSRTLRGPGAALVVPPRGWSHAIRNDGEQSLWIVAVSDEPYDRHETDEVRRDAVRRVVTR